MRQFQGSLAPLQELEANHDPEPLSDPCAGQCESRASGPHTEAEYNERIAASRRGGLAFVLVVLALVTVAKWMGAL